MENNLQPLKCNEDDIIAFQEDIFKIRRFMKAVNKSFNQELGGQFINELVAHGLNLDVNNLDKKGYYAAANKIFKEGVDCQFLNVGAQSWKKGKVRININVEFYAEENNEENQILNFQNNSSESPLDDLRKMIN